MAMDLLQAGVDRSVIALWLGHERLETTQVYLEATLAMKEKALAKVTPQNGRRGRYNPETNSWPSERTVTASDYVSRYPEPQRCAGSNPVPNCKRPILTRHNPEG